MIEILNYDNLTNLFIEISQFTGGRYLIVFTSTDKLIEWISELYIYSDDLGYAVDFQRNLIRCQKNNACIHLLSVDDYKEIKSYTYDKILYEDGVNTVLLSNIRPRSRIFRSLTSCYEKSDALSDFLSDFSIIN